jgi:hypothetical protein
MTAMGSIAEGQDFFSSEAKPPYRFRERGSAPLMADYGRLADFELLGV